MNSSTITISLWSSQEYSITFYNDHNKTIALAQALARSDLVKEVYVDVEVKPDRQYFKRK